MIAQNDRRSGEDELQGQLRDLLCLAVVGDHVRWVARGDDTDELVDWLAGAIVEWRELAERIARQLVASGVAPDGRIRSLAKDIPVNWVPAGWLGAEDGRRLIEHRLHAVTERAYVRCSQAIEPERAALLRAVCSILDAQLDARRGVATVRAERARVASNAAAPAERLRAAARGAR